MISRRQSDLLEWLRSVKRSVLRYKYTYRPKKVAVPASAWPGMGEFQTTDGRSYKRLAKYRNRIKAGYRYFWPARVLVDLGERIPLSPSLQQLADQIQHSDTVPVPLEEIADALASLATTETTHLVVSGHEDPYLNCKIIALQPTKHEISQLRHAWRAKAEDFYGLLLSHGLHTHDTRALEIGCGAGYLAYALASLGIREIQGIDIEFPVYPLIVEKDLLLNAFDRNDSGNFRSRIMLSIQDAQKLPFESSYFDLIYSNSVLEHIADLPKAVSEMARVIRPGGMMVHSYDPWYSPRGGHSLCTLDFPWGHVRLSANEWKDYIQTYRPHEARQAIDFYEHGFQSVKRTLDETLKLFLSADFELLQWNEGRFRPIDHSSFLAEDLLDEMRNVNPAITYHDLITSSVTMLFRKRQHLA